jgi:hypothetical protein
LNAPGKEGLSGGVNQSGFFEMAGKLFALIP